MNIAKINITQNQKKIILVSSVSLLVFLLIWVFLYLPASKEIGNLKTELSSTQMQIEGIEAFLNGSQSRDEAMRLLKDKQQYLIGKFPDKEEESLRFITEFARKNSIEVVSLQPGMLTDFLDEAGQPTIIEGKLAKFMPIALEINCFYKDLVKYLIELKKDSPAFISVVSLNVQKNIQVTGKVRAIVKFNLYLLI